MADIDISTGLAIKADINQLYGDIVGTLAKFKENRTYSKDSFDELLDKYGVAVAEIEKIRNQLNSLIEDAQANKLPDENDLKAMDAIAGLMGAKNQDGSLDFQKLMELDKTFNPKDDNQSN